MWFPLKTTEIDFVERSNHRFENEAVIEAPAGRVFDLLVDGDGMARWFADFVACRWTSPGPHGVGSTREIELKALTVKERFLVWEPGKRVAFAIYAITIPLVSRMVEDMELEMLGPSRTRILWRAHYEPSLAMRLVHPIGRAVFGKMFRKSLEGLSRAAR